jgi:hypothetical protein
VTNGLVRNILLFYTFFPSSHFIRICILFFPFFMLIFLLIGLLFGKAGSASKILERNKNDTIQILYLNSEKFECFVCLECLNTCNFNRKKNPAETLSAQGQAHQHQQWPAVTPLTLPDPLLCHVILLDAVSPMPKRSFNNTGAKVYKSNTSCWRKFILRYSPTINTRFLQTCSLPLRTPNPFLFNDPHHHVYSTQQQMTRQ